MWASVSSYLYPVIALPSLLPALSLSLSPLSLSLSSLLLPPSLPLPLPLSIEYRNNKTHSGQWLGSVKEVAHDLASGSLSKGDLIKFLQKKAKVGKISDSLRT